MRKLLALALLAAPLAAQPPEQKLVKQIRFLEYASPPSVCDGTTKGDVYLGADGFLYICDGGSWDPSNILPDPDPAVDHPDLVSSLQENGANELRTEDQGTACAENLIPKANATGGWDCAADATGGSPSFDLITTGTNVAATMTVGTGASIAVSGSGTVAATSAPASGITGTDPGTNLTVDLEEEAHASEHSDGAADEIVATNLASPCTDAQVLGGTSVAGGVECQADDTGNDTLDDLSDDLPTALSNVTTITNTQFCVGNAGGGFDCTTPGALADDDLSDDLPSALSNVTTLNNGQLCEGNAGGGFDCDVATISDAQTPDTHTHTADSVDLAEIDDAADTPAEGEVLAVGATTSQVQYVKPAAECKTWQDSTGLVDTDDTTSFYRWSAPVVVDEVWCEVDAATSATITVEDGAGNDLATSCVCTTAGVSCTLTANDAFTDGELVDLQIVSLSGSPLRLTVCMEYNYDL